jgi:antitoxin ChpS
MYSVEQDVILRYNFGGTIMHTTNLRKVGGSVMLAVPRAILDLLHLEAGATVGLAVDGERLVVQPQAKPRYTIDELLAQCDPHAEVSEEDHVWLGLAPSGREL